MELIVKNNRSKQELSTLQQIRDTFTDPEHRDQEELEEDASDQKFKNAKQQQQQSQLKYAESEASTENSNQQTQIQIITEIQQKIQKSENAITTNAEQKHQEFSDREIRLQDQEKINNKIKIKDQRGENLDLQDGFPDLRSGEVDADNEKSGAEVGAFVTGGVSASNNSTGTFVTGRESDVNSSGAVVGASAKGEEEPRMKPRVVVESTFDGEIADEKGKARASSERDLRRCGFCRVSPIVAKPLALMAAMFPWDRESGLVTVKKKGEAAATCLVSPSVDGLEEEISNSSGGKCVPQWVAVEEEARKKVEMASPSITRAAAIGLHRDLENEE